MGTYIADRYKCYLIGKKLIDAQCFKQNIGTFLNGLMYKQLYLELNSDLYESIGDEGLEIPVPKNLDTVFLNY